MAARHTTQPGSPDFDLTWLKAGEVSMLKAIRCADGIQAGMEGGLGLVGWGMPQFLPPCQALPHR